MDNDQSSFMRVIRAAAFVALCAVSTGCTTLMDEPTSPTASEFSSGLTWTKSLEYLAQAKSNMKAGQTSIDDLNKATKSAVGLGVGGAAVATMARARSDLILGLLTVGGASYSLNQASIPDVQSQIYKAGLDRLACIERVGISAHDMIGTTRDELKVQQRDLNMALAKLQADVSSAGEEPQESILNSRISAADKSIVSGRAVQQAVASYLAATNVAFDVYSAVDQTVRDLNDQLRLRALKIDEVAKAANATDFVNARLPSKVEATKQAAALGTVTPAQANHSRWVEMIAADLNTLIQVLSRIQVLLPAGGAVPAEKVNSCLVKIQPDAYVAVDPESTEIAVTAGGKAYALSIESNVGTLVSSYSGMTPNSTDLSISPTAISDGATSVSISAPVGAKADKYTFNFRRATGPSTRVGPVFTVTVSAVAAAASQATGQTSKSGTQGQLGTAMPLKAQRTLIGMGQDSKPSDPTWIMRVQKLNNCFQLSSGDGVLREPLIGLLKKSPHVRADGTCPVNPVTPQATTPGPTATQASGAASAVVPVVPKSPLIGPGAGASTPAKPTPAGVIN